MTGPHGLPLRAYLGVPVLAPDLRVLGSLAVIDVAPRAWTAGDVASMTDLAQLASTIGALVDPAQAARDSAIEAHRIAAIAHDARGMLCSVVEGVRTIDEHSGLDEHSRRRIVGIVERQASALQALLMPVLDFNATATSDERPSVVDLGALVEDVVAGYQLTRHERVTAITTTDLLTGVDSVQLRRVLHNLLDNALTHGGAQTRVTVDCRTQDGNVVLRVLDDGSGIPQPSQAGVFARGRRGEDDGVAGYGLGLHLVRELVEDLGGTIDLESRPESGTAFTIALPAAAPTG